MFSSFNEITSKVDKFQTILETWIFDKDVLGYIPGMQQISYKGMIYGVNKKKRYTDLTYKDMPTFDFKNNLSKITI